ncbi:MAG: hypothetical protein CEE40_02510 [Chloroflexi bacterium B3_Chlor]|nr:MAG: hypothetical protein CEE40_02510 [Chloroflexi bacterium B3_Chlor]
MRLGKSYEQAVAQERLPVRRASRSRARIGPRVGSLSLAIILVSLLAYFFMSDAFYVYEATVLGSALVSADEVFQRTNVEGFSIFFIDPQQVEDAIRGIPDIREAIVQVSLPNQMIVEVGERQARVMWQTGEQRYGVDDEGTILPLRAETEPSILIRDLDSRPRQAGEHVDLEIISAVERYRTLLPGVKEFGYSQQYGLSLENEHGWRVYLGNGEGAEVKVAILKALVQRLESQGATAEFIDLRFQEGPHYRLAGELAGEP